MQLNTNQIRIKPAATQTEQTDRQRDRDRQTDTVMTVTGQSKILRIRDVVRFKCTFIVDLYA